MCECHDDEPEPKGIPEKMKDGKFDMPANVSVAPQDPELVGDSSEDMNPDYQEVYVNGEKQVLLTDTADFRKAKPLPQEKRSKPVKDEMLGPPKVVTEKSNKKAAAVGK